MKTIFNDEKSFKKILSFCKKYFENVKVIRNKKSHATDRSQNFYITILFENRGSKFSIQWNYAYCCLYLGDISNGEKSALQFTFTKIKLDNCYPIEIGNNYNVVFWQYEITEPLDNTSHEISPLRLPITIAS